MKFGVRSQTLIGLAVMLGITSLPTLVQAQSFGKKDLAGWGSIAAGTGMMIGAFNYAEGKCLKGYSTHTFEVEDPKGSSHTEKRCVILYPSGGSNVYEPDGTATFARLGLMWAGSAQWRWARCCCCCRTAEGCAAWR